MSGTRPSHHRTILGTWASRGWGGGQEQAHSSTSCVSAQEPSFPGSAPARIAATMFGRLHEKEG